MIDCDECGETNPAGSSDCQDCGAVLSTPAPATSRVSDMASSADLSLPYASSPPAAPIPLAPQPATVPVPPAATPYPVARSAVAVPPAATPRPVAHSATQAPYVTSTPQASYPVARAGGARTPVEVDVAVEEFRVGQLCQLTFRLTNRSHAHAFVTVAVAAHPAALPFQSRSKDIELEPGAQQRLVSFAFVPPVAGRARLDRLSVVALQGKEVRAYELQEGNLLVSIAEAEQRGPNVVIQGGINVSTGRTVGARLENLVNFGGPSEPSGSGAAVRYEPVALRLDPVETSLQEERLALRAATEPPREELLVQPCSTPPLRSALLLIGQGANARRVFLFANERLRLGRQGPKPGDPSSNDVVLRVQAPPHLAGGAQDPNRRLSRKHCELLRNGGELQLHQVGSCRSSQGGQEVEQGQRVRLSDEFLLNLGYDLLMLQGRVNRATSPIIGGRISVASPGASALPPGMGGGVEARHPILSVTLARPAPSTHRYLLVLRQAALGSAPACALEVATPDIAPVHLRILNLRGVLAIQPVVREGLTTHLADQPCSDPATVVPITAGMSLNVGGVPLRFAELSPQEFLRP